MNDHGDDNLEPIELSFSGLVKPVGRCDQDAAGQLIARHAPEELRVVRRRLPNDLRSKFDSQGFAQASGASIVGNPSRLRSLHSECAFRAYSAALTNNKVRMEIRCRLVIQKYNVNREMPLEPSLTGVGGESNDTPSDIAVARARWNAMVDHQPAREQRMLHLRFEGLRYEEVAATFGVDDRTVRRTMQRLGGVANGRR